MAVGTVLRIPSGQANLQYRVPSGYEAPTVAILNPNDGVVYLARNRPASSLTTASWDWKIPSQSYALLPGPFITAGILYLDQSGAGSAGEVTLYDLPQKIVIPVFQAIGRAVATGSSAMDIAQGAQPANPPANTDRLWADGNGDLWVTLSNGSTFKVIDSNDALGGALTGTLPNPGLATGAVTSASILDKTIQAIDVADGFIGLNSSLIQDGAINAAKIQANTISDAQISVGAISGTSIQNGSLTSVDLAANAATIASYTQAYAGGSTTSTTPVAIPGTSISLTCVGGAPIRVKFHMPIYINAANGTGAYIYGRVDGGAWNALMYWNSPGVTWTVPVSGEWWMSLSAGAHTIELGWALGAAGTLTQNGAALSVLSAIEYRR